MQAACELVAMQIAVVAVSRRRTRRVRMMVRRQGHTRPGDSIHVLNGVFDTQCQLSAQSFWCIAYT